MKRIQNIIIKQIKNVVLCNALLMCLGINVIAQQCVEDPNVWDESWVSCQKVVSPNPARANAYWLQYEFDQKEAIENIHIWNANRNTQSAFGAKDISIDYSEDGVTWVSLGNYVLPKADESSTYAGVNVANMNGQFAKKILITVMSNYNNLHCVSIAEVKFNIDDSACYGIEDVCGVCDGSGEITWYADTDGDGLGDPLSSVIQCIAPPYYVDNADDECDNGLYGWDVMGALFEDNGCTGCHGNSGGSGGLSLTTYDSMIQGGNKCGTDILTGGNLAGIISVRGYAGCGTPINGNSMNQRVGGNIDDEELTMIQDWINSGAPEYCACPPGSTDADGDGHCDAIDMCPEFDNDLIGTACDDGLDCTTNDIYNTSCNCQGTPTDDTDNDGICDALDSMPYNPCTADGSIGLPEPAGWIAASSNDCDGDGINVGIGDLDDYDACIDEEGYSPAPSCACPGETMTAGGVYVSSIGIPTRPELGGGLPNGFSTGFIGFLDELVIGFPYLEVGEVICFTVGFSDENGRVNFNVNDLGNYKFDNVTADSTYAGYEYCFEVFQEGIQTITVSEIGSGGIKIYGSRYNHCPCSIADPNYEKVSCRCPSNNTTGVGTYVSSEGITTPENADGAPDGIVTGTISGVDDSITMTLPDMEIGGEICLTVGMNSGSGRVDFNVNGEEFYIYNQTGEVAFIPQQLCFLAQTDGLQTIIIKDGGGGTIRVDGISYSYCNPCTAQSPDSDGDGICDAYDACPNSALNDSDNDGVCDDIDICLGSNDSIDSDGDGIPNGCDMCPGFDDGIDTDGDNVSNGCDVCEGSDDTIDSDNDGIPDGCDNSPCLNFISELTYDLISDNKKARINIQTNGTIMPSNSVSYKAGTSIILKENFEVKLGSIFLADIEACN